MHQKCRAEAQILILVTQDSKTVQGQLTNPLGSLGFAAERDKATEPAAASNVEADTRPEGPS